MQGSGIRERMTQGIATLTRSMCPHTLVGISTDVASGTQDVEHDPPFGFPHAMHYVLVCHPLPDA
jgi:hypothetical protein